jgi:hypothetical protein
MCIIEIIIILKHIKLIFKKKSLNYKKIIFGCDDISKLKNEKIK